MIIGSAALSYWNGKQYNGDIDIISDVNVRVPGLRIETHSPNDLNNANALCRYATQHFLEFGGVKYPVCSMRGLALIKRSHMHRTWKWDRNLFMLKELDWWGKHRDYLSAEDKAFLADRILMTKTEIKSPSLMKTNEEFFDDYVEKHFDHDSIHEFVAYYDRPIYERLKRDFALAKCEKDLWQQLPQLDKIRCVLEECYVIGLERFIVPALIKGESHMPMRFAVRKALKKVCTTLCSGWFRDFAIDFYTDICELIDTRKMDLFVKEKLNANV